MLCVVQHRAVCAVLGICTAGHRFLQLVRANDEGRTRFAITMVSHHILRLARIRVWSCIGWLVRCAVCCVLGLGNVLVILCVCCVVRVQFCAGYCTMYVIGSQSLCRI